MAESDIPANKGGASAPSYSQVLLTVNTASSPGRGLLIDGAGQIPITYLSDNGETVALAAGLLGGVIHPIRFTKYTVCGSPVYNCY